MDAERETIRVRTEGEELVVTVKDRSTVRMTPERAKDVAGQLAKAVDAIAQVHPQGTFGGVLELDVYGKLSRLVQEGVHEWSQTDDDALKDLMGHTDVSTTRGYVQVSPEHLKLIYTKAHPRA